MRGRFLSGTFIHDKVRRGDFWQDDLTACAEDEDEEDDWWGTNFFEKKQRIFAAGVACAEEAKEEGEQKPLSL